MKSFILFLSMQFLVINLPNLLFAQDIDKTVILVVSGQGATQEEARQKALRGAIEEAFGVFISSKTEILNDNLVKDEIVSVANGNIQKFDVISETLLPNNTYASTLSATVSISNLTTFCQSKGISSEFKGGLFATNILMQELYEKNEFIALKNVIEILKNVAKNSFDYNILTKDPISNNGNWNIPLLVSVMANKNFNQIPSLLLKTISSISLFPEEAANYNKLNKPIFPVTIATLDNKGIYYLRNQNSMRLILDFVYSLSQSIVNFEIENGIEKFNLQKYNTSSFNNGNETVNLGLDDNNFRIILKKIKNRNTLGYDYCGFIDASLFMNSSKNSKKPNFDFRSVYMNSGTVDNFGDYIEDYMIEYGPDRGKACYYFFSSLRFKPFFPLKKIMLSNIYLGLVISFANITEGSPLIQFSFNDVRNIDEIKKITEYKVVINQ